MEKINEQNHNHFLNLSERKNLVVSGVNKVDNFDSDEFVIKTNMGILTIKGSNLELIKLDTLQGNISIKGTIDSLEYSNDRNHEKSHGIFNRLFK